MSLPTPTDSSVLFTWKIEEFSKVKAKKLSSKIFHCGGYEWRLLIIPNWYIAEYLSVYLEVPDPAKLPHGWSRYARFSISVVNQIHNADTKGQHQEYKFNASGSNWGFSSLLPLRELNAPEKGFLVNDTVVLEAVVTIPNSHDSRKETGFEPNNRKRKKETGDNGSGNVEADIAGTSSPQSTLQSILGSQISFVDASSDATSTAGKVRFLSYWVSSEALLLLEKIHSLHEGTYVKFSMKGQALPTMLLESFAAFIASMSSTKVNELNEEALRLAANSIEDFEQVGLDLRWLKQRLEEAKVVKKHSESVNTVESCTSALEVDRATVVVCARLLEVARANVRELEEGLAKAKAEGEVKKAKKLYSKIFHCGGYEWRLLVFPKGCNKNTKHLSVYLEVPNLVKLPYGWSRYARFSISVVNQIHNEDTKDEHTEHKSNAERKFDAKESNWGFTSFLPLIELNDPDKGFLVNDTIVLEASVTIPNSHDSRKETGDNGSGNVEADIAGTTSPQSMLQSILGSQISFVDASSDATATAGKVRFLSYWVSSEALLLLEKIHSLHEGTYVKFSMKGQALPTMLLESFAEFIASMSFTKVNELNEEALRLAANSIEDFEQVGLDLRWLKQRLEEAKVVKKHSDSVNTVESCTSALEVARATVDSCTSALEVARAKVRELEDGLAKAKLEGEVMFRELPKSLGVNDSVLKDIV
ncbi:hypothetical protein RHGRI_014965 [Rhododendron griersonianum]|uniref:MATH domain-containing protein n=1 Tax=Rhododendron griersonianum TaxID=479676 RepID=A0AAV6KC14_9ERIC|nr:hypothetical protein RHGRI_014965 [Rhododendron griersonianum]